MVTLYDDELKIYRGGDIQIKDNLIVHQPTLGEITDYGERDYFNIVYNITSVPADLSWQLWEMNIDYTELSDYELFYMLIYKSLTKDKTSLLFGDFDFSEYELKKDQSGNVVLYNPNDDSVIGELTYLKLVEVIRKIHMLKRNDDLPGNEATKIILIEDAKEQYLMNKDKPYESQLKNWISAMTNCEGFKFNHNEVWDMKINAFMDSVSRISKIKNANLLLQSGYSGFGVSLKDIDKKEIDWLGDI